MRMWLPAAQDMLYNYINKCGYTSSNETDWIINM